MSSNIFLIMIRGKHGFSKWNITAMCFDILETFFNTAINKPVIKTAQTNLVSALMYYLPKLQLHGRT